MTGRLDLDRAVRRGVGRPSMLRDMSLDMLCDAVRRDDDIAACSHRQMYAPCVVASVGRADPPPGAWSTRLVSPSSRSGITQPQQSAIVPVHCCRRPHVRYTSSTVDEFC